MRGVDPAFDSADEWTAVSPRLATARRLVIALVSVPLAGLVVLAFLVGRDATIPSAMAWAALGLWVLGIGWSWWLVGRRVRSFGYCERGDDLLVRSGIMFRRLVIVPYGRMQLVDVRAGPIDRWLGITSVQLHTAAATTDAAIPGLTPEVAAALRDRLARQGEQRSAGL
jgi:membrane protein YdbS with pleckstrin-like domain